MDDRESPGKRAQPSPDSSSSVATDLAEESPPIRHCSSKGTGKGSIREITVSGVALHQCNKKKKRKKKKGSPANDAADDAEEEKRYVAIYNVFLSNCSKRYFPVRLTKECWESVDRPAAMRDHVRKQIEQKALELGFDYDVGAGLLYMYNDSPWIQMWAQVENEIHAIKMEAQKIRGECREPTKQELKP